MPSSTSRLMSWPRCDREKRTDPAQLFLFNAQLLDDSNLVTGVMVHQIGKTALRARHVDRARRVVENFFAEPPRDRRFGRKRHFNDVAVALIVFIIKLGIFWVFFLFSSRAPCC
jgi:hypothetical protein